MRRWQVVCIGRFLARLVRRGAESGGPAAVAVWARRAGRETSISGSAHASSRPFHWSRSVWRSLRRHASRRRCLAARCSGFVPTECERRRTAGRHRMRTAHKHNNRSHAARRRCARAALWHLRRSARVLFQRRRQRRRASRAHAVPTCGRDPCRSDACGAAPWHPHQSESGAIASTPK